MRALQAIAMGSLSLYKSAADQQTEQAVTALNKIQLPGAGALTLFKENKNLGDYLKYIDESYTAGSPNAKSLTPVAQIGAVALPALAGSLLGGGSLLSGLGRGALTGLGGLAGYEGGRMLANSDYVKKLVPAGSSLREIAPWITTAGGALLGHLLSKKLMGEEKSAAVMEKYASYYEETADVDMEKVAFAALAGWAGKALDYGSQAMKFLAPHAKTLLQNGGEYFKQGLNWIGNQGGKLLRQSGPYAENGLNGLGNQMNGLGKSLTNGNLQQLAGRADSMIQQGWQAAKNYGSRLMEAGQQGAQAFKGSMAASGGAAARNAAKAVGGAASGLS